MNNIAKTEIKNRNALFHNTAAKMGLTEAIIEKDFWVCYVLDYLFHRCRWKKCFAFKGGTSLSKAYHLIERFSEDIDLILDWRLLGYGTNEPWIDRSNTKQDMFNKQINEKTVIFLREKFLPTIMKDLQEEIGSPINCFIDKDDPQTVIFAYQNNFYDVSILPVIRLEIGALAAWTPAAQREISPYTAIQYPVLFQRAFTQILTVLPERTFWEKVTILHAEANRPEGKFLPTRYSRHYYDLFCMANSPVKNIALANVVLLEKVAHFKEKFYRSTWAKYENARIGTVQLMPSLKSYSILKDDYKQMQNMLFGVKPSLEEILSGIEQLEKEINEVCI